MPEKEQYTKICPKCGSIDVQVDFSNPVVWAYGTTTKYKCNSCGHMAPIFPDVFASKILNFRKKLKQKARIKPSKENLIDASTGFNVAVYELVIIGVVVLLIMPILLKSANIMVALIVWFLLLVFLFQKLIRRRKIWP